MSIDIPLGPARYHSFASANQPEEPMAAKDFVASHVKDAVFVRGLRPFFDYRDLGIRKATHGRVVAHVIRAIDGADFSGKPHLHETTFQMVYVLKGWIEFEYEGHGKVRLEAGSCAHQPPGLRHRSSVIAPTWRCSKLRFRPTSVLGKLSP